MAMLGDYHLAGQPYWGRDFKNPIEAIIAADLTWDWMWGTYGTSWTAEAAMKLPKVLTTNTDPWSKEMNDSSTYPGEDGELDVMVVVYDPDHDELVEFPLYVRGSITELRDVIHEEKEDSASEDRNRSNVSNAPEPKRRSRTRGVRKRTRRR